MKTEKYTLKFKDGTVFKLEFPTDTNQINYDNLNSIFPIQITLGDGREIFLHMYHLQSSMQLILMTPHCDEFGPIEGIQGYIATGLSIRGIRPDQI